VANPDFAAGLFFMKLLLAAWMLPFYTGIAKSWSDNNKFLMHR
jgi:hypothetical protein